MDTGKDAQGMAGCPELGVGGGPQGGAPEQVTGTDVSNLPPSGWCVVCRRTAGEGVWKSGCSQVLGFPTVQRGCSQGAGVAGQEGVGRDDPVSPSCTSGSPPGGSPAYN